VKIEPGPGADVEPRGSHLHKLPGRAAQARGYVFKGGMKYLKSISNLLLTKLKFTLQCLRTIAGAVTSFRIYNWLSFIAGVLGFVGTFAIVMDKFEPIHRRIDRFQKGMGVGPGQIPHG
jgi:hypothetical protein